MGSCCHRSKIKDGGQGEGQQKTKSNESKEKD